MECGEIKYLELALMDLFTRVKFGTPDARRFGNGYLMYDSVGSGAARFIKSSWIRLRGEIGNQISAILDAREESQSGGNAFSIKRDGLMQLVEIVKGERYNQSAEDRDKGLSLPHKGKGSRSCCFFLAITLMDGLNRKIFVPFEPHFDEKSKQSEDHLFLAAVEEAMCEVKKRSALGLTCKCLNPSKFRPTEVQGFLEVDVAGYGARSKYSIEQIKKARYGFKPRQMFSFLQKLALNPTIDTQNNFTLTRNVARVLAYRKSVFEEPDETYPQEFEAQAADNEHHADVHIARKSHIMLSVINILIPFKSHSEFSESADALVIMGKHSPFVFTLDAINLYPVSCLHFHVVKDFFCLESYILGPNASRLPLEELEDSPQLPRSHDPLKIDDSAKQVKAKVPEVGIQNNNLRKNVPQRRSPQDTSMPQLRIFDSDDLSRSNKKRSSPHVHEETITRSKRKGRQLAPRLQERKSSTPILRSPRRSN
ncbi:UNVERIFIED_CONTAM: hypothetical protein Sangu_3122200 [Sesamum angustifolium]|uniref:Uncharacterized protein n=1 Tax=Sesamum angustifolium TaxID=2727405 RepID=A0AAW2K332_9LAMI